MWVAILVLVRNKSGEIKLCMDFRYLIKNSTKDNYLVPSLDEVFQIVSGSKMMSFLDGFSGYDQLLVDH